MGLALSQPGRGRAADPLHAGPLFDTFDLTLASGYRSEILGPLFYSQQKEAERTWAIPPLLSYARDPELDVSEFDFVYPVLTCDRYGDQYRWQLFQLLSLAGGPSPDETARDRFTLFPLYFQQRSSDPTQNYTAVFPFYGHLKNRFFRDEIFFVLFPCYGQTRKRDVMTDNYLYPIFHLRKGDGLRGWQFWPLVGHEHKVVTTRTNGFQEIETIGGHDKFFALWPIFFNHKSGLGTENPVWQQGVLPLYSLERSPQRDSTTVLWPFFSRIDDRQKKYREWELPWPLVVFARGEGKTTSRVFPFFSQAHSATLESDFYMWPVYKYKRIHADPLDYRRTRILYFLYSNTTERSTETGAALRRVYFWPLFTHTRDFNGNSRWQFVAPLEPFVPGAHKIERDYSPVWSVWRWEHNPRTGASSQSLLWNLFRRDVTPAQKRVSFLFGLFQSQSGPSGTQVRLFYIPLGKSRAAAPQTASRGS